VPRRHRVVDRACPLVEGLDVAHCTERQQQRNEDTSATLAFHPAAYWQPVHAHNAEGADAADLLLAHPACLIGSTSDKCLCALHCRQCMASVLCEPRAMEPMALPVCDLPLMTTLLVAAPPLKNLTPRTRSPSDTPVAAKNTCRHHTQHGQKLSASHSRTQSVHVCRRVPSSMVA
jgi:hypothetical protein